MKTNRECPEIMDDGKTPYTMRYRLEPDPNAPTNLEMWAYIKESKRLDEQAYFELLNLFSVE